MKLVLGLLVALALSITSVFLVASYYSGELQELEGTHRAVVAEAKDLREDKAFYQASLQARDQSYLALQTGETVIERVVDVQKEIVYKYIPNPKEVQNAEVQCLKLTPPADLIQRVRESRVSRSASTSTDPGVLAGSSGGS